METVTPPPMLLYSSHGAHRQGWRVAFVTLAAVGWCAFAWLALVSEFVAWNPVTRYTAALWFVSTVLSIAAAALVRLRWGLVALVAVLLATGVGIVRVNWALVAPAGYFAVHRADFAEIGNLALATGPEEQGGYYVFPLPPRLDRHSSTGNAGWVGCVVFKSDRGPDQVVVRERDFGLVPPEQKHVWFVPQWTGIPDDAGGYLFVIGRPTAGLTCDLYGRQVSLSDAVPLGSGWWFAL